MTIIETAETLIEFMKEFKKDEINDIIATLQNVIDEMSDKPEFAGVRPSVARAIADLRSNRKLTDMPAIPTLETHVNPSKSPYFSRRTLIHAAKHQARRASRGDR
nr:hypothetical protein [Candidatus Sigynarchaeota archaeon]